MDKRRRTDPAVLELLIGILKVAVDRRARDRLIRFVAHQFDVGPRELERRIGMSHASVTRIVSRKQGRGESGLRSAAALKRWSRTRGKRRRANG